jgi:hypothetical protein
MLLSQTRQEYVRVTYYTLPGTMADNARVHLGAAACSRWMPMGQRLRMPDDWVVTCEDRGLGDRYWAGWVDVWAPSRAWGEANVTAAYGDYAWVSFLEEDT